MNRILVYCLLYYWLLNFSVSAQTIIIAPQYDNVHGFSEELAAIKIKNLWGFIDMTGKIVIKPTYLGVRDFHEGLAAVKTSEGWGYIDRKNNIVIPCHYELAGDFSEELAGVKNQWGAWQFIDKKGESYAANKYYKAITPFHNGIACVKTDDDTWGFIDKKGADVVKDTYKTILPYSFSSGMYPFKGGDLGECGYKDITGKWIIQPDYRSVTPFVDGVALVEEYGGTYHFIDNKGNVLATFQTMPVLLGDGFFQLEKNIYKIGNWNSIYYEPISNLKCIPSFYLDLDLSAEETYPINHFLPEMDVYGAYGSASVGMNMESRNILLRSPSIGVWAVKNLDKNGLWGFVTLNMNDFIYRTVSALMDNWLRKGEFESTSAYENRTSETNRQQKEVALADELINNWLKKGLDTWTLSNYDADNETFTLTTDLGTYKIKIPVGSAKRLKDNWASVNKQVGFKYDNGLTLAKIDFTLSQGSKDMTLSVNTATGTIQEIKHDIINKDLPSIKWLEFMATTTSKEYSIKLGVNSKSKIESVSISVNGTQDRGVKTVNSSDYDLTINRTLTLNEGMNIIKVSVRNAAGTTQEEKTIVYRPQGGELPTIEWLDFAATANKKEYQMKLGIKSKSKIEEVNVTLNGNQSRGIKTVQADGYDLTVDRTLALSEGVNRIVVSVRNGDGIATSEKVITYQGINPTPVFNDKRIAFVVGNSHYSRSEMNLANPENDAKDVAEKLKGLGFEVVLKLDATLETMDKELSSFKEKAKDYDVAMFYYAGHGIQSKGVNYIIPTNIDNLAEDNMKYKCVDMERVLDVMEDSHCKLKIVILDACRNDPLSRRWHRSAGTRGLSIMSAPTGTIISYSTAPGKTALDGEGRNSPYTEAFLYSLDMPNLDVFHFFQKVGAEVKRKTKDSQDPWWSSSFTGDFYFNKQ